MTLVRRVLFWGSAGVVAHTLVGMPLALAARARLRPLAVPREGPPLPVTVVIPAHDEQDAIGAAVAGALGQDIAPGLLRVVVACDGCTDETAPRARAAARAAGRESDVLVCEFPRGGKNAALGRALDHVGPGVVLFTDADAALQPDVARRLTAPLADPGIGGAAGRVLFGAAGSPSGEVAYWSLEDRLRRLQTRGGSLTSAPGPIYAMRRELVQPPPDGVTDDFWISVHVPLSGSRLVFVPEAVALLPAPPAAAAEFRRKVRMMCRGLRGVWSVRGLMRPRFVDLQIVTHKVLRRLLAAPGLVMVAAGLSLARRGRLYAWVGGAGAAAVAGCAAASAVRGTPLGRLRPVAVASHVALTASASLVAAAQVLRGTVYVSWDRDAV